MVKLEPITPRPPGDIPRLWLVFFGDAEFPSWWSRLFRPGFRHVSAAAWYASEQRWVYYNPARRGTVIDIYSEHDFDLRLGYLCETSAAVLRVRSRFERGTTPAGWHCVGAIKALLGVRSCALGPHGFYRHLLATGAETVEVPNRVRSVRRWRQAPASAGGPGGGAPASTGAGPGGGRADQGDTGPIAAGNLAA